MLRHLPAGPRIVACVLCLWSVTPVWAQGRPNSPPGQVQLQRYQVPPGQGQPPGQVPGQVQLPGQVQSPGQRPPALAPAMAVTPEMDAALRNWEKASAQSSKVMGELQRLRYDETFKTVTVAQGRYWYEVPDKGRLDFEQDAAVKVGTAVESKNAAEQTVQYTVAACSPEKWVCTGASVFKIDQTTKTYDQMDIPKEFQGTNIGKGPLPFLFGMKADDIKKRYILKFGQFHDPQKTIHIVAVPLLEAEQMEFSQAEILIDPRSYLPTAVLQKHPAETGRTVYTFKNPNPVAVWLPTSPFGFTFEMMTKAGYTRGHHYEAPQQDAVAPSGVIIQ